MSRVELECVREGLVNDISLRRITRSLIEEFNLPDGRYNLESSAIFHRDGEKKYSYVALELCLPESRPVRRGTAVVGGTVRLFLRVITSSLTGLMDLSVCLFEGPNEKNGETHYEIDMSLFGSRAGLEAVSA